MSVLGFLDGVDISSEEESFFRFSCLSLSVFGATCSGLTEPFGF
jgi:hypothetical protein